MSGRGIPRGGCDKSYRKKTVVKQKGESEKCPHGGFSAGCAKCNDANEKLAQDKVEEIYIEFHTTVIDESYGKKTVIDDSYGKKALAKQKRQQRRLAPTEKCPHGGCAYCCNTAEKEKLAQDKVAEIYNEFNQTTNKKLAQDKVEREKFNASTVMNLMHMRDDNRARGLYHQFTGRDIRLEYNMASFPAGWDTKNCVLLVLQQPGWPHGSITMQLSGRTFITVLETYGAYVGQLDDKWLTNLKGIHKAIQAMIATMAKKLASSRE
jgi:hypothetical protein